MQKHEQRFAQKTIIKHNLSMRSFTTPRDLGPQFVQNDFEADTVTQLAASIRVRDLITHPLIPSKNGDRTFCPDIYVQTELDREALCGIVYILYIQSKDNSSINDLEDARIWCGDMNARLRIIGEAEIYTPYLENARILERYANAFPDCEPESMSALWEAVKENAITVRQAAEEIAPLFESIEHARWFIEACIAKEIVACDLSHPFGPDTKIDMVTAEFAECNRYVPILRLIEAADNGSGTSRRCPKRSR